MKAQPLICVDDVEAGSSWYQRTLASGAVLLEELKVNTNANHREFWLRDPDGYVVVVAGRYADLDGQGTA